MQPEQESSIAQSSVITIYHIPCWRSTRAVWCYQELLALYSAADSTVTLPRLAVHEFDPATFRTVKPDWFLNLNPNGKVPFMEYGDIMMFDSVAICLFFLHQFDKEHKLFLADNAKFLSEFYQTALYCSGTVDNLTASSSPVQMVIESKVPRGLADYDHKAWSELCGLLLSSTLDEKQFFFGDEFTALDVIIGFDCLTIHRKTDGWLEEFPNLSKYYHERIAPRPAFQLAITSTIVKST